MSEPNKELAHKIIDNLANIADEFVNGLNENILNKDGKIAVIRQISNLRSNLHISVTE